MKQGRTIQSGTPDFDTPRARFAEWHELQTPVGQNSPRDRGRIWPTKYVLEIKLHDGCGCDASEQVQKPLHQRVTM